MKIIKEKSNHDCFRDLLIIILILFGTLACSENKDTIKIGAVLPLTGASADWGEQGRYGIEIAVEEVNSRGGINGKKLEVIFEDSQAIPKNGIIAIRKLIHIDNVSAVIGDIVSATTLAMAPIAEKSKVVLIAPTASAPAISLAGEYIYRVWPSDFLEGEVLANFIIQRKYKSACVLYIKTDYGTGLRDIFSKTFEQAGNKIEFTYGYMQDETNFTSALLKAKINKVEAAYLVSYYKDAGLILKQAKEIGLKINFFGVTAIESPKLLEIAGSAAEGLIYPIITDFDPDNPSPAAVDFINRFKKKFGLEPDWASSHTHDAVIVIAKAIEMGGENGESIKRAIDSQKYFDGVTGKIIFDENGDVIEKPVTIKVIKDGKFQIYRNK